MSQYLPWLALVGIPLNVTAGAHEIQMTAPLRATQAFHIDKKVYKKTKLAEANACLQYSAIEYIRYPLEDNKDTGLKSLKHWSDSDPLSSQFVAPLHGRILAGFGLQKMFRRQLRCQHTGLDIAANVGEAVKATAAGIVLDVIQINDESNTLYLDHGQGLISVYTPLSNINLTPGQHVPQDKILGLTAAQASTTPYLHWGIALNQVFIDPTLFVLKGDILIPPTPSQDEPATQLDNKPPIPENQQTQ